MGKVLKEIKDDGEALAQWVFRKLRNHDPMSVRVKHATETHMLPNMGVSMASQGSQITIDQNDKTKVYYKLADGRCFSFQSTQVDSSVFDAATIEQEEKQAVLA